MVIGIADRGPAQRAGLRNGDIVRSVSGEEVSSLAALFRRIWACGPAGGSLRVGSGESEAKHQGRAHAEDSITASSAAKPASHNEAAKSDSQRVVP